MKNIFITGGSSGLGLALAQYYLAQGQRVGICGRHLENLPTSLGTNPYFFAYQIDVNDRHLLRTKVMEFAQGKLDLMIANAGIGISEKISFPNFNLARQIIDTNVKGVLNAFDVAFELMHVQRQGQVVAISSIAGMGGLPGAGAYVASKAAVLQLCESYFFDFRHYGISVTAICPGFIDTPLTQKNNHPMPFLVSLEKATHLVARAISARRVLVIFPWQMALIMSVLARLPRWVYRTLMLYSPLNYNRQQHHRPLVGGKKD